MSSSAHDALLTGFPALRGRALLRELLAGDSAARVHVVVHPERRAEAEARLAEPPFASPRVELVEGDPAAIDFGLAAPAYSRLARDVGYVHAAYSITDPDAGEVAEGVNVAAARELCAFAACASGLRVLVLYSSVFVCGQRRGLVREDELEAGQSFPGPVERSLAVAERMLRNSAAPWLVLRAGHLLGDAEGEFDLLSAPDVFMGLVAGAPEDAALPRPPRADSVLAVTPLDYLARLGVFAAQRGEVRITAHAIDPSQPTLGRFLEILAERSGRRMESGFNATALTRILVNSPATRVVPRKLRGILDALTSTSHYATEQAERLAEADGPGCPPLESYLERLLARVEERIKNGTFFPARRREAPFLVA